VNINTQAPESNGVVIDVAKSSISDLWTMEDYWAIWLGFLLLICGIFIFFSNPPEDMNKKIAEANAVLQTEAESAPFKTIAWHKAADAKLKLKANSTGFGKKIKSYVATPHGWKSNPLDSFLMSQMTASAKNAAALPAHEAAKTNTADLMKIAQSKEVQAKLASYKNETFNKEATTAISAWLSAKAKESSLKKKTQNKPYNQLIPLAGLCIFFALLFGIGYKIMGKNFIKFSKGFGFVFVLAIASYMLSAQATMKAYGIGYAAWGIAIGLLISNTIGTPTWVKEAVQTEYYIKTGLVLLGAEILFGKILSIGIPGIFVAWVVTPIVLISTYWFGQKVIKIPSKTLNMTISADMSVCGVSAAIATAAACRAKKEELTLAVGLSLVFTSIMMIVMPAVIKATGMPYILGGAWMGGTIDATGAVAAAGAFLSEEALYTAATIKMIQNVLIGVIAFCVAFYWVARVDCAPGQKVSIMEIWHRFPKFVIGFIGASIIFSTIYGALGSDVGYTLLDQGVIRGLTKYLRSWFFCLAFVSIGLATNFRELKDYFKGGKPLILYVCGQTFNLILTLTMAYIMFYLVFPEITAKI
jgi:uncharacterized membrane protein YadS